METLLTWSGRRRNRSIEKKQTKSPVLASTTSPLYRKRSRQDEISQKRRSLRNDERSRVRRHSDLYKPVKARSKSYSRADRETDVNRRHSFRPKDYRVRTHERIYRNERNSPSHHKRSSLDLRRLKRTSTSQESSRLAKQVTYLKQRDGVESSRLVKRSSKHSDSSPRRRKTDKTNLDSKSPRKDVVRRNHRVADLEKRLSLDQRSPTNKRSSLRKHKSSTKRRQTAVSASKSAGSNSKRKDDSEGWFVASRGDRIDSFYRISHTLGEGTFGRVVQCTDTRNDTTCAVKVVRAVSRYVDEARTEAEILESIQLSYERCFDSPKESRIVQIYDHFKWRDHYCIVFEKLGMSLYDYVRKTSYKGLTLSQIRVIARDILEGLEFLHEVCDTVHTDLKLENVMLENIFDLRGAALRSPYFRVKLIDFGGATKVSLSSSESRKTRKLPTSIINTRQYRSPEVTLRVGWDFKSDMWSLGCILAELLFGELLFQTHDELEHLALIERIAGPIPLEMRRRSKPDFFDSRDNLRWPPSRKSSRYSSKSVRFVERQLSLLDLFAEYVRKSEPRSNVEAWEEDIEHLTSLITSCLEVDPANRISAHFALESAFFLPS